MNTFAACRSYLDKLPPAVSGAGGHPATFRAACECVRFGLGDADALALLLEYNRRCSPPWAEKELAHKLTDARRKAGGQVRTFRQSAPAVRVVWPLRKTVRPAEPVKVQPLPAPVVVAAPGGHPDGCPHPGGWLPERFIEALRTWTAFRTDPEWRDHPQLTSPYPGLPSFLKPVFLAGYQHTPTCPYPSLKKSLLLRL